MNDSYLMHLRPLQLRILVHRNLLPPSPAIAIEKCTMLNGPSSSTTTFWKHTSMEWWLNVVMTSCAIFTHVYSLIWQITRRSKYSTTAEISKTHIRLRIIIVGLHNLGHCPCPRCLIPMDRVPNMGMQCLEICCSMYPSCVSMMWSGRIRIKAAHEAIYEHNHGVGGVAVEKLLKEHSLVPAAVGGVFLIMRLVLMFYGFRMHSLTSYHYSTSICLRC